MALNRELRARLHRATRRAAGLLLAGYVLCAAGIAVVIAGDPGALFLTTALKRATTDADTARAFKLADRVLARPALAPPAAAPIPTVTIQCVAWGQRIENATDELGSNSNATASNVLWVESRGGLQVSTNGGTNWLTLIDRSETNAYPFGVFVDDTRPMKLVQFRMQP